MSFMSVRINDRPYGLSYHEILNNPGIYKIVERPKRSISSDVIPQTRFIVNNDSECFGISSYSKEIFEPDEHWKDCRFEKTNESVSINVFHNDVPF